MSDEFAQRIVDACETDPPDRPDGHPRIFEDLEDDRIGDALFKLWQKGILEAEFDPQDEETRWGLSEFGVELNWRGLSEAYICALESDIQIDATPTAMEVPQR